MFNLEDRAILARAKLPPPLKGGQRLEALAGDLSFLLMLLGLRSLGLMSTFEGDNYNQR